MTFTQNNLDRALSPYLNQHRHNPIWWQEWSQEAIEYAREHDRVLFVSVGYATCHWCHVMASEAFSDTEIADYVNRWFLPIKVDREQRPDIDHVMMQFLVATTGQGGWPLNVFLSPGIEPFFALTYAPPASRSGMPGFLDILHKVKAFYEQKRSTLRPLTFRWPGNGEKAAPDPSRLEHLVSETTSQFDSQNGGMRGAPKFPPHSSLLFLLHQPDPLSETTRFAVERTLDSMLHGGLHDHLQGGFFRYCVDVTWTIPHFEKMLYDQALMIWNLSLAYRRFGHERYRDAAAATIRCLDETFLDDCLFYSAHDADTADEEGGTYLWSYDELCRALTSTEFELLSRHYHITRQGNFEGKIHLVRRRDTVTPEAQITEPEALQAVEQKLLALRRRRAQPETDRKHVTAWNCLTAIGLLQAERSGIITDGIYRARSVLETLVRNHWTADGLARSSIAGQLQHQEFLEDHAALTLLAALLHEETGDLPELLNRADENLKAFHTENGWVEAANDDFLAVPADTFDHPTPTGRSLALWGRTLTALQQQTAPPFPHEYGPALQQDAYNCAVMLTQGEFHQIDGPAPIPWARVPINTVQVRTERPQYCYQGVCRPGLPEFAL